MFDYFETLNPAQLQIIAALIFPVLISAPVMLYVIVCEVVSEYKHRKENR